MTGKPGKIRKPRFCLDFPPTAGADEKQSQAVLGDVIAVLWTL
jgi:hypothetical protein